MCVGAPRSPRTHLREEVRAKGGERQGQRRGRGAGAAHEPERDNLQQLERHPDEGKGDGRRRERPLVQCEVPGLRGVEAQLKALPRSQHTPTVSSRGAASLGILCPNRHAAWRATQRARALNVPSRGCSTHIKREDGRKVAVAHRGALVGCLMADAVSLRPSGSP